VLVNCLGKPARDILGFRGRPRGFEFGRYQHRQPSTAIARNDDLLAPVPMWIWGQQPEIRLGFVDPDIFTARVPIRQYPVFRRVLLGHGHERGRHTRRVGLGGATADRVGITGKPVARCLVRLSRMAKQMERAVKGAVAGGSGLYMGTAALSERDYVHWAIDRADLIIAIGHDTVEKPPFLMGPKGPLVLHVGYLRATVEEVYFPHAELVGDVGPSLALLADRLEGKLPRAGALLPLRQQILARIADRAEESRYPLTPQRIVHDVRQVMPEDGIVCLDNGMYKIWFARNYRTRVANTLLLDNALATMGAGLPSAIMAAMLNPTRRVLAVCGDGGFMMNSQELETAVRLGLNLVVFIIQDNAYGMIRWKQTADGYPDFGMTFGNPDFVAYGNAYGIKASRVEGADGLVPALETAFAAGGVQLVAVPVDYSENIRVLVDELHQEASKCGGKG
jgi:acetolactate synthase I/II/III large subunit